MKLPFPAHTEKRFPLPKKLTLDLNCDLGEGFPHDAELMRLISSANIACCGHAGDLNSMIAATRLAWQHGVAAGSHPGFEDQENFGRRVRPMPPRRNARLVTCQVELLQMIADVFNLKVRHVKLHGALYHLAARKRTVAQAIVRELAKLERPPILFAPSGSLLERVARAHGGLRVASEVFADRTYQGDGSLTPRQHPNALISDPAAASAQVWRMLRFGLVRATDGTDVEVRVDTVCVHGDSPNAVEIARRLKRDLRGEGIIVRAPEL